MMSALKRALSVRVGGAKRRFVFVFVFGEMAAWGTVEVSPPPDEIPVGSFDEAEESSFRRLMAHERWASHSGYCESYPSWSWKGALIEKGQESAVTEELLDALLSTGFMCSQPTE